ncbi:3-(3-hydroxy-phenyl)propionate hydroxylase [Actinocorallia herbida]|uniref:3-(3-hydroxy-phenyl)propionate hydroxylase n=1 Tax=Actinocorallia herbida TaxID=58109 RepID=A0A3N1CZY7_9ACTN|nr:bifunctional 3-(3-hydroxy-phenyl)propionate/3-hydroxycinnamic acid hydroxylase [Actinocorallia herbida]ROO86816.1 3-(3-hydroxy-phenyl)propionate hydroxylase [Actinocorallia herbida]
MSERTPVLIVGAGPTGTACAILLARYGVPSLVVERHPEVYRLPRAVHLDDEVLRVLQALGVADAFTGISRPAPGMRLLDARLRPMAEFHRDRLVGEHGWPESNLFDQPDLELLLRAELAGHPEARLLTGVEVEKIEPGDAARPAVAVLRDVDGGAVRTVEAQAVLGCDGANSLVRATIGAEMRDLRFTEQWLVIDVRCAHRLGEYDGVDQICDPRRAATFMRIGAERYRWEFRMRDGETPEELTRPESLTRLLAPWTGDLPFAELEVIRSASYTFKARVADRWRAGRLFLLGDAAHLTPPFIGQGMCAGLRDAANLSWKLAAAGADPVAGDGLLDTYQSERAPHVTTVVKTAVSIGRAMTGGQDKTAFVRRALLGVLTRIAAVRHAMTKSVSPPLGRGPLVAGGRLAGTFLPQPSLTVDGAAHRLDDLLGTGFTVVTRLPATPSLTGLAADLNAVVVHAGPDRTEILRPDGSRTTGHEDVLAGWLSGGRAVAAVVRPDRTVLTSFAELTRLPAADWRKLLPPTTP